VNPKIEEFLSVLDASPRTQVAILAACVIPSAILIGGVYGSEHLVLAPPLDGMIAPVRELIFHRYLEAATVAFFGFGGAAIHSYRKTRERLLSS
jgi:hypothetical protein